MLTGAESPTRPGDGHHGKAVNANRINDLALKHSGRLGLYVCNGG